MCLNHPALVHKHPTHLCVGVVRVGSMCLNHPEVVQKHPADKAVLNKFKCIYIVKKDKQKNKTEHNTTHQSFKPFNSSAMSLRLHNELVNFEVILCLLIFELSQEVLIISASENLSCSLFMTLPLTACSCLSGNLEL